MRQGTHTHNFPMHFLHLRVPRRVPRVLLPVSLCNVRLQAEAMEPRPQQVGQVAAGRKQNQDN